MSARREFVLPSAGVASLEPEAAGDGADRNMLKSAIRKPARAGLAIIFLFWSGFAGWCYFAPLKSGAIAAGVFSPDGSNKVVQHLEGGIVSELRIHDGDVVTRGEPLVVLEEVQVRATRDALEEQQLSLLARQARLSAESSGKDSIDWPPALQAMDDPRVKSVRDAQGKVFETRRATLATRKDVLHQRIAQLRDQMDGFKAEIDSARKQIALVNEELDAKRTLVEKGLIPKPEYLRVARQAAELNGRLGEYISNVARTEQGVGEAKIQLLAAEADRADQVADEADKVRTTLSGVVEKLRGNNDILKRRVITAPVSGTIINLKLKTIGGVVRPGEPIFEIVPSKDSLVIDAHVTPLDIKAVHKGMTADVHLSAYSSRSTPRIPGIVESVSADRLMDDITHQPYYLAKVAIDASQLKRLAPDVKIIPGMPAEVLIVTGQQTMFEYLTKPLRDSFRRSLHEA